MVTLSEANAPVHSRMDRVRLGVFFPHEIAAAFYNFRSGDLFYSMLTGTPEAFQLYVAFLLMSEGF